VFKREKFTQEQELLCTDLKTAVCTLSHQPRDISRCNYLGSSSDETRILTKLLCFVKLLL